MIKYIDRECNLDIPAEITKERMTVPTLINKIGNCHQFVFMWKIEPIHATSIQDQDMANVLDGLREVRGQEQFNFVNRIRPVVSNKPKRDLIALNEYFHKIELSKKGLRRELDYYFYATYTITEDAKEVDGPIERFLAKAQTSWDQNFAQSTEEIDHIQRITALNAAHETWLEYEQVIRGKFKFTATSLSCDDIYRYCWELFNKDECPSLPYCLYADLDRGEFEERDRKGKPVEAGQYYELISYLVPPDSCPRVEENKDVLRLPGRDRYVGVISFEDIPDDYGSSQLKYRFLWDAAVKDSFHPYEMEIVTQITYADPKDSLEQSRKFAQQQKGEFRLKEEKGREDRSLKLHGDAASEAQDEMIMGDLPCYIATVINVYAPTETELKSSLRRIRTRFSRPTIPYIERDYPWKFWLQSTPLRVERLCTSQDGPNGLVGNDFRLKVPSSASIGMIQLIGIRSSSRSGVEVISKEGRVPLFISLEDSFGNPRRGIQYGLSGSGKSVHARAVLDDARLKGVKISIQDMPDASGRGSYMDWCRFHGGVIVDTGRTKNNILELPKFNDPGNEADYLGDVEQIITALVVARENANLPLDAIESIISTSVSRFYQDPIIRNRIEAAREGGVGSRVWQDYPILIDYYNRVNESLNPENDTEIERAINYIRMRLRTWLESPLGKLIASPSEIDILSNQIVLFSLRNVKAEKESRVFGLSSFNAAMRRSLDARRSFYLCDEVSEQVKHPNIANYVGRSLATARKNGVSIYLLTQDCGSIDSCAASSQIKANLNYFVIGKVAQGMAKSYETIHGIPEELLKENEGLSFKPSKQEMSTQWMVIDEGLPTAVHSRSSPIGLGLALNDEYEYAAREFIFGLYADKELAASKFGELTREICTKGGSFKQFCFDQGIEVEEEEYEKAA